MKNKHWVLLMILPLTCLSADLSYSLTQSEEEFVTQFVTLFCEQPLEELTKQADKILIQIQPFMHVSPFQLIGYILTQPTLVNQMSQTLRNPPKAGLFIQGFGFRMMQEVAKEGFYKELGEFCALFNLKADVMKAFVEKSDWSRFLLYCFKGSTKAS